MSPSTRSTSRIPRPISRGKLQRAAARMHSPTTFSEPLRGTAMALIAHSPATEADIQAYILNTCAAIEKVGYEHIKPTGTKFVWVLVKEDLWPGQYYTNELLQMKTLVQEDGGVVLEEDTKEDFEIFCPGGEADSCSDAEAARKMRLMRSHKGTSLAALIAGASKSDFLPGDDGIDTESVPCSVTSKQSTPKSPSTPTKTRPSSPARSSPDNDTSPEIARVSPTTPRRHGHSLAALIAAANLSDSEGDSNTASDASDDHSPLVEYKYADAPKPDDARYCYDPVFPGHSPCDTREQLACGKSAKAAIKLLRRRFAADHDATGDGSWYREWIVWKGESGVAAGELMHGGSMLRYEITFEEDEVEELENKEKYDESGFLYELDEHGVESEEDVGLESSSPFDYTVGVYVPLIKEATDSLLKAVTDPAPEKDYPVSEETNVELHCGCTNWSHIPTPAPATRTIHIRNASMNDVWGNLSSVRTSIFSKRSMVTTKSSRTSVTANHLDHSNLIEALDLSIKQHKSQDGFASLNEVLATEFRRPHSAGDNTRSADESRESASVTRKLSIISLCSRARDEDDSLCALGTWIVTDEPAHIASKNHPSEPTVSATNDISPIDIEHVDPERQQSTTSPTGRQTNFVEHFDDTDSEADYGPTPIHESCTDKPSRSVKWIGRMKSEAGKVSGQVQAAVKSTRMFTRTLVGFVPAALKARNPFQGV